MDTHKCDKICDRCLTYPVCPRNAPEIVCDCCNKKFYGEVCYGNHLKTTCEARKECKTCFVNYYPKTTEHKCGVYKCKSCGEEHDGSPHACVIGVLSKDKIVKEDKVRKVFVAFDTETRSGKTEDGFTEMIPNLIISQTVCDLCYNYEEQTKLADCNYCGTFTREFFGDDCSDKFVSYVCEELARKIGDTESRIFVFAHNLSVS